MGTKTGISWTDATWNPIRGCSRVSEGCRNCYAEHIAYRFSGPGQPYEGLVQIGADGERRPQWNGQVRFVEEHLFDPLKWKQPRRIFVNSMSDLFHENVTDEVRDKIFAVMALRPQHTFQVLTKRPERMLAYLSDKSVEERTARASVLIVPNEELTVKGIEPDLQQEAMLGWSKWPLPNVWLGVSVEDQKTAEERIPSLLRTPAAVRFISAEPLLGAIDLTRVSGLNTLAAVIHSSSYGKSLTSLDWVIVGGESGPGARPMHPDWARSLRDQCKAAGVSFFFKQWGEWRPPIDEEFYQTLPSSRRGKEAVYLTARGESLNCFHHPGGDAQVMVRAGTKAAGHLLDGAEHHEFPEVHI